MIHRFKFRVPVRSNSTPDVPFGFENLIELWIRYTMTMPQELQELDVCLRRNFRELRELFGGFLNVERVNFALLSKDYRLERSHGWESNMTERMRYASNLEEFGCLQVDFTLLLTVFLNWLRWLRIFGRVAVGEIKEGWK